MPAGLEALILVASAGGPTMLARIGVMRAVSRRERRTASARKLTEALTTPS